MNVHVTARRNARAPFGVALDDVAGYFSALEAERPLTEIRMPLCVLLGFPFPGVLRHPVRLTFGTHSERREAGPEKEEIAFSWQTGTRFLPAMHGLVRASGVPEAHTTLEVVGTYAPPFGLLGRVFNALVGRRLAQYTVDDLARHIAEHLESAERAYRSK